MKKILLFLARLIIFSLLLVPLLPRFDLACRFVLVFITSLTLPTNEAMKAIPYVSSVKLYPFFVLVLATPRLAMGKRLTGIAGAILFYLVMDFCMILIWRGVPFIQIPNPTLLHVIATNLWDMLGHWLLPFLFWFMVAYRQIGVFHNGGGEGHGG